MTYSSRARSAGALMDAYVGNALAGDRAGAIAPSLMALLCQRERVALTRIPFPDSPRRSAQQGAGVVSVAGHPCHSNNWTSLRRSIS
jgi:hypothetical protein